MSVDASDRLFQCLCYKMVRFKSLSCTLPLSSNAKTTPSAVSISALKVSRLMDYPINSDGASPH